VAVQHLVPKGLWLRIGPRAEPLLFGLMAALSYLEAGPDTAFIYFQF
jgi:alginate O-acetyltransferase complex protein AlgI